MLCGYWIKNKIPYTLNTYECAEFIDGVTVTDQLGQPYENSFKALEAAPEEQPTQ